MMARLFLLALVLCAACRKGGDADVSAIPQGGAQKGKCPADTHDPEGRPAQGQAPTAGSEYATISEAIDTVAQVAAATADAAFKATLEAIVKCLRDMLKNGQICVTDKDIPPGPDGFEGKTIVDTKAGWGADIILLNRRPVHAASGGAAATATAEKKKAMKHLAAIIAHEGVHAGDPNNYSDEKGRQTKKQKKDQEQAAVELEKEMLKMCGYDGNGSKYQFLCWWLFEMCSNAARAP
jgi:hypothetical protein